MGFSPGTVEMQDSKLDLTDLGIGGYYMIVKSEHSFASGQANTTIHAKWVNAIEEAERLTQCRKNLKESSVGSGQRESRICRVGELLDGDGNKIVEKKKEEKGFFGGIGDSLSAMLGIP